MVVVVEVMVVLAWPLKLPLLCPAGICRLPATGKAELSVERLTCAPPMGAGPLSVIVTVA